MAFSATTIPLIAHGNNKKLYFYSSSADAMSTILGSGYFNSFYEQLDVGDVIICQDSANLVSLARITASSSTAVTVSYVTGFTQQAAITALTDSTGETADDTVAQVDVAVTGVDGVGNNAASKTDVDNRLDLINKNCADLAAKINAIRTALNTVGIIA